MRGYEEAAKYVMNQSSEDKVCLFDGFHEGTFACQVRVLDPGRSACVIRGDKVLYSYLMVPQTSYKQFVESETEILTKLFELDPTFVVVEKPERRTGIPISDVIRTTLRSHPERFRLERSLPVEYARISTLLGRRRTVDEYELVVYRNICRNPNPSRRLEFELQILGRQIDGIIP